MEYIRKFKNRMTHTIDVGLTKSGKLESYKARGVELESTPKSQTGGNNGVSYSEGKHIYNIHRISSNKEILRKYSF